jgi:hypothetical protein
VVEGLAFLLNEWASRAFPTTTRTEMDAIHLEHLWRRLAWAAWGPQSAAVTAVVAEMAAIHFKECAGDPPIETLKELVGQAVRSGLRDLFIVAALRQTLDLLIEKDFRDCPAVVDTWAELADSILPRFVQLGLRPGELPENSATFRVGG